MARLVGFIGNRPDLGARALAHGGPPFTVRLTPAEALDEASASWGIGFYQGGEILLKRRPFDERRELDFGDLTKDVKADVLVGHVRTATIGALRTENTHPFRYRQWLFAQTGTLPHFDRLRARLLDSLPQFLARDVRGETDAELVFYIFLSFLHDGGRLDRTDVDAATARSALRSAISLVDRISAEVGENEPRLNMILACSEYLIGVRASNPMGFEVLAGRGALERLYGGESLSRTKIPHLAAARLAICASDFDDGPPPSFTMLKERSTVTLAHDALSNGDAPVVEAL